MSVSLKVLSQNCMCRATDKTWKIFHSIFLFHIIYKQLLFLRTFNFLSHIRRWYKRHCQFQRFCTPNFPIHISLSRIILKYEIIKQNEMNIFIIIITEVKVVVTQSSPTNLILFCFVSFSRFCRWVAFSYLCSFYLYNQYVGVLLEFWVSLWVFNFFYERSKIRVV